MSNVKISICIPTYNGAVYLRQCIETCISQTYQNIEVILVDDVSSDDTLRIANEYATSDNRIKIFKNEKNLGLVGNWNKCIEHSTGEWIKFVFQDDYIDHDCIQKFVNAIEEQTQFIVSKRSFILLSTASEDEKEYYNRRLTTLENTCDLSKGNNISAAVISKIAAENIAMNFIGEPSLVLFKKAILSEVGFFNSDLTQLCDLEFNLRVATNYGLTYIPEQLCHFRIHHDSTTSKNVDNKFFILSNIEPILLVKELLYDGRFTNFRKSIAPVLLLKLNGFFKVRVYEAYKKSRENEKNKNTFNAVCDKFPEIRRHTKAGISIRLMYLLIVLRRKIRNLSF